MTHAYPPGAIPRQDPARLPLEGWIVRSGGSGGPRPAQGWATRLLTQLGAHAEEDPASDGVCLEAPVGRGGRQVQVSAGRTAADPATDWAESGAMELTGIPDGAPLLAPGEPASAARGAALAIELLTTLIPGAATVAMDGAALLGERAAAAGLTRRGDVSAGGTCRLVPAEDGLLAVNLPRPEDFAAVPAWLEILPHELGGTDDTTGTWEVVMRECAGRPAASLVERARLLGIPVAAIPSSPAAPRAEGSPPWHIEPVRDADAHIDSDADARIDSDLGVGPVDVPGVVADFSSMWAGPLCANLLGIAGFEIVKIESIHRPDGARLGPRDFFDLMHGGHRSIAVDFSNSDDVERLREFIAGVDVVIESSRPRALGQLGLGAETFLNRPGRGPVVWVSVTGFGRRGPLSNAVAFGDDAAASAGLVAAGPGGRTVFCGDAIADPLAGLHAALAALGMWVGGCAGLVDVSLHGVAASVLVPTTHMTLGFGNRRSNAEVSRPRARPVVERAPELGSDTEAVLGPLARG